jgi:hypothetical protein
MVYTQPARKKMRAGGRESERERARESERERERERAELRCVCDKGRVRILKKKLRYGNKHS